MGTRERREREKEKRRAEILNAGRKLFLSQGYEATTIPAIAAVAELAPGTLYLYFPSKQALYIELLNEGYELLLARLRSAIPPNAPPRRQAAALVDAFFDFALEHPDYFDIIFFILQSARRQVRDLEGHRQIMEKVLAREKECRDLATEILRRVRPHDSAAKRTQKVEAVWAMLAGVVLYFVRDDAATFKAVAAEAKETVLNAFFAGS